MRGHQLITKILTYLALSLGVIMASLNLYPSWSQYARSLEEPLLLLALSSMASIFLIRSFAHPHREVRLYRLIWHVRLEHTSRYAGFFFMGILCTPVTHPAWWIETLHLVFTFLAMATAYSEMINYLKGQPNTVLKYLGLFVGVIGMLGGLWLNWWTVGIGEVIAAFPIAFYILGTNK